jgi:hypothetical protein
MLSLIECDSDINFEREIVLRTQESRTSTCHCTYNVPTKKNLQVQTQNENSNEQP